MKSCKDFEQEIYFYRELTKENKEVLENHLAECAECRELFAIVQQTEAFISKATSVKPELENAARLTGTIIQNVANRQKQRSSWISNVILRYSMAATSLIIIIAFGVESFPTVKSKTKPYPLAKTATLNSASLAKAFLEKKEQPEKISLYACVKSEACTNPIIQNFKKSL